VHTWGYAQELLDSLDLKDAELFAAACGGGCPLMFKGSVPPAKGECVVDLGCGAGHDCLLASRLVGSTGRVIGVDLTQAMLDRAARNIEQFGGAAASRIIELKQGIIEDGTALAGAVGEGEADLVISNGVFNLTVDKEAAFRSAYRILKPGGRLQLCDVCRVEAAAPTSVRE